MSLVPPAPEHLAEAAGEDGTETVSAPPPPFLLGLCTSAVAAASLNLAVSTLDRPRAFDSARPILLSLGIGVALCALAYVIPWLLVLPLRRWCSAPARAAAAGALIVGLGAGLPLVEVLGRSMTPERMPALFALLALGLVSTTLLVARWSSASPAGSRRTLGGLASFVLPFLCLELLVAAWLMEYRMSRGVTLGFLVPLLTGTWFGLAWLRRFTGDFVPVASLLGFIVTAGVLVWFESPLPPERAPRERAAGPARIVLLTVDTLRPDYLSELDPEARATPQMDSLLKDSVVFTQARSAAPWTKPALASILTGLYPSVHRTTSYRARLPENARTLAEHLSDAGYLTAGVGLNVHLEQLFNFGQGFDDYFFPARDEYGIAIGAKALEALDPHEYPELFPSTEAITDVAIDWIENNRDESFFLWVHYLDPHWPYEPPPALVDADPPPRMGYMWGDHGTVTSVQAGTLKLGAADQAWVRELYEGEVSYTDANIGRLLGKMRTLGLYDDALIAFASDHGEEFWEHGTFEHGHTMFDEVLRVPLAFKLPGNTIRERVDAPVSTVSLAPTLLEAAGLPLDPEAFSTRSLAEFWVEGAVVGTDPAVATGTYYHGDKFMVLFDGYKYVRELDTKREFLFDLAADPEELNSLTSSEPARIETARELHAEHLQASIELAAGLGIEAVEGDVDGAIAEQLRALGYLGE